jgi:hypothetical protein
MLQLVVTWGTLLVNAKGPNKTARHELQHPWSTNEGLGGSCTTDYRANYTTLNEVPTGEEVLPGTFSLNEYSIIILFDSGASHDFMSSTCVKKEKLSLVASRASYVISTPGGRVDADRIVQKFLLELAERIFSSNLIILSGQGIDVILGMSWMKMHRAVLDIVGRLIHLDSPMYGKVILHLLMTSRIKASLHHMLEL